VPSRNSPAGDRLDVLITLVESWERKHYALDLPDPVGAIKYHMDQNGLAPRDLIPFIGSRNRVHESAQPEASFDPQNDSEVAYGPRYPGRVAHKAQP
jgi:hypothetical protein